MSDRGDGAPSGESTGRPLFARSIALGRQNTPILIWLAVLVVTAIVIGRKASSQNIDTAHIVLIALGIGTKLGVRRHPKFRGGPAA
jgi:hypothetical protein